MNSLMKLFAAATLTSLLSGCVIAVGHDENDDDSWSKTKKVQQANQNYISQLKTGVDAASVRNSLGTPDFTESFQKNGDTVEVLFYRTHRSHGDGVTSKDECTALIFQRGLLVGWGDKAYQQL
ncbi:DUF3192 domain-containing protein [Rheinheimera sp. 4Y26]|uniref:DUF3192 domain-containing protein n=1 Tax=Rheinheimera sp. 4Y26 TaxID=2977811 RepID=UPI0021B11A75|nr:DUF3192 domain-containing protein [Rheinheimera sp. 4Y26]MCT6700146.1 DUF3192 domain-containing protein [Rheinheimera sp. 4Y26]